MDKHMDDTERRHPSIREGARPQKRSALPGPWPQTSGLQDCEKINLSVYITQSVGLYYGSPSSLIQGDVEFGFPGDAVVKNSPANAGDIRDTSLIPGLGRSPGEGNCNPLQYSSPKILWTEEPGRLQSRGSQRVGHDWATEHMYVHRVWIPLPSEKM